MRWRSEFVKTRSLLKRSFLPTMANQHRRLNSITREKGRTISNPLKRAERRILRTVKEMEKKVDQSQHVNFTLRLLIESNFI